MQTADSLKKSLDAGKDWGQKEKRASEDEMAGWHHRLNGYEFGQTLGGSEGQGGLVCCSLWGHKKSDMTGWLNNSRLLETFYSFNPYDNAMEIGCIFHILQKRNLRLREAKWHVVHSYCYFRAQPEFQCRSSMFPLLDLNLFLPSPTQL